MADEDTIHTSLLISVIVQFLLVPVTLLLILYRNLFPPTMPPGFEWFFPILMTTYNFVLTLSIIMRIGLAIIWLLLRSNPIAHRTKLFATGLFGLLFDIIAIFTVVISSFSAGWISSSNIFGLIFVVWIIPELLVVIAGIITPKK